MKLLIARTAYPLSLAVVFFLSGSASIIYQVVWQRVLTLYYGVGPVSTAIVVAVYMLGLGLGGYLGGKLADRGMKPVRAYAVIEISLAVLGVLSIPALSWIGSATAGADYRAMLFIVFALLLVPTLLMGMTLPLLVKLANGLNNSFAANVSRLYFINTLGAAFGAMFAAYVLISLFGLDVAAYVAAATNLVLAVAIYRMRFTGEQVRKVVSSAPSHWMGRKVYLIAFATGFIALGLEIVWFRVVGVPTKASSYSFATVLAVMLFGIALGSLATNRAIAAGMLRDFRKLYFTFQYLIGLYVLLSFGTLYWLRDSALVSHITNASIIAPLHPPKLYFPRGSFDMFAAFDVLLWPLWFVLVPALFMGAAFPILSYLAYRGDDRDAGAVGTTYFFTIFGNVTGSLATAFVLLPTIGTELTVLTFAGVSIGFLLFGRISPKVTVALLATPVLVILAIGFPQPGQFYSIFVDRPRDQFDRHFLEGVDSTITTFENRETGRVINYVGGLSHGGHQTWGVPECKYAFEASEALTYANNAKRVLIIGFGTGGALEAVLGSSEVEQVDVVEISETLISNLGNIAAVNNWLSDERVNIHYEDGRRFLQQSDAAYDTILLDALRGTTSYANNIYSLDFMELIGTRLSDGGTYMTLLPEGMFDARTAAHAFDNMRRYRAFAVLSDDEMNANEERRAELVAHAAPECREIVATGEGIGLVGDREFVLDATQGYPINTDMTPHGEYYFLSKFTH